MGKVHADLMGTAGFQSTLQEAGYWCAVLFSSEHLHIIVRGDRRFSAVHQYRHFQTVCRVAANIALDHPFLRPGRAPDQSQIAPVEVAAAAVIGKLSRKPLM